MQRLTIFSSRRGETLQLSVGSMAGAAKQHVRLREANVRTVTVILVGTALLSSCANPLNRVTSDNYAGICSTAEQNRNLSVAEEACYRALVNVDIGNLGPELKSQRLYNLARIKRQLTKFAEAEELLKQSLALEEKLSNVDNLKISRRLIELSINLAAQDKWNEGAPYLERAMPMADQFVGAERSTAVQVFLEYGKYLRKNSQPSVAERFEAKAAALR